jgi:hypothetical protein
MAVDEITINISFHLFAGVEYQIGQMMKTARNQVMHFEHA